MLAGIKSFLRRHTFYPEADTASAESELRMAVAMLLLEVAQADSHVSRDERRVAQQLLERYFPLSPEQAHALVDAAHQQAEHATSLYPFTSLIKDECSMDERARIVEMLWKISFVDGRIDPHEEHLIRKVAELLYVPHGRFIQAKLNQAGQ